MILYCICMEGGVAVGPVIWFFNDTQVTLTQSNRNSPYYRDNVPGPLIIPLFVSGNDGIYRCGPSFYIEPTSDNSITLTLPGTYVYNHFSKLLLCILMLYLRGLCHACLC